MILNIGDIFTLQERETKKWFTFQIIRLKGNDTSYNTVYADLDYWSDRKPVANDLAIVELERKTPVSTPTLSLLNAQLITFTPLALTTAPATPIINMLKKSMLYVVL